MWALGPGAICLGLVHAVDRFDLDTGADFLSFAVSTVMGEVRGHFRDFGWAVKVPRRCQDLQNPLTKARGEVAQQLGRSPTASEVAEHCDEIDDEQSRFVEVMAAFASKRKLDVPVTASHAVAMGRVHES